MKLSKLLVGSAIVLPTTIVPLTTITSCGQSWGSLTPFTIGSTLSSQGPYQLFASDTYYDVDKVDMVSYLQSNYSVKQSSNEHFGYSTPDTWDDETKKFVPGYSGWYSSSDNAFTAVKQYKDEDGKSQTKENARNSALSNNISLVAAIGSGINNYINYALAYQAQQVNKDKDENKNLDIAWGCGEKATNPFALDHGKKGGEVEEQIRNKQFYEFNCALSNLNSGNKAKAMLRTSAANFTFEQFPIPSYSFTEGAEPVRSLNTNFLQLIEGKTPDLENLNFWSSKQTVTKTEKEGDKDVEYKYDVYTYKSVPIEIAPTFITQSFVNPSKGTSSFLVNDYYSDNEQILKTIGNQWKDLLTNLTDYTKDEAVPHYKSFKLMPLEGKTIEHTGEKVDTRLSDTVKGNEFIGLVSYQVSVCYTEDGSTKTYHHEKDTGIFNTMDNLFPAFFLEIGDKAKLYETVRKEDGQDVNYYMINQKTINTMNSEFLGLIQRTSKEGHKTDLTKLSEVSQNYLKFLGYMFGGSDGSIVTDEIISPTDEITA